MRAFCVVDVDVILYDYARCIGSQPGPIRRPDRGGESCDLAGLQCLQVKPDGIVQVLIHRIECHRIRIVGFLREHLDHQGIEGRLLVVALQVVLNHHARPSRA